MWFTGFLAGSAPLRVEDRMKDFECLYRTRRRLQTTDFWRSGTRPCGMKMIFEKSLSGMVKASRHPRFMVRTGAPE